jgi:hypothetical protein
MIIYLFVLVEQVNDTAMLTSFEYLKSSVLGNFLFVTLNCQQIIISFKTALETREGTLLAFCRTSVKKSLLIQVKFVLIIQFFGKNKKMID